MHVTHTHILNQVFSTGFDNHCDKMQYNKANSIVRITIRLQATVNAVNLV
jgi:hypothetical protein